MQKARMMYEGKAKKVYATDDDRYVIVSYKDDATAFNGQKKEMCIRDRLLPRINRFCKTRMERFYPE